MSEERNAGRWGNIKAQLGDGSVRIRYFGGLAICLIGAVVGYLLFRSSTAIPKADASQVATVPDVAGQSRNGQAAGLQRATPAYDNLVAHENAANAAQAKRTGDSAVPVIRSGVEQKADFSASASQPSTASAPQGQSANPTQAAASEAAATQQYQEEMQRRQQAIAARATAMRGQVNLLIQSWQPKDHVTLAVKEQGKDVQQGAAGTGAKQAGGVEGTTPGSTLTARTLVKAGDPRSFGELETAINSDDSLSPIRATIHTGPLKGTILLGKVELPQNAQAAGIHFTIANIPDQPNSIAVDAWAIDPETSRAALASDVDNHYFQRYGTLFAASFLGGFGDALLKGGQHQQIVGSPGGVVVETDAFTTKQLVLAGAGNVGKQLATNMSSIVNRPATVKVDGHIGIGILFMSDVTLK